MSRVGAWLLAAAIVVGMSMAGSGDADAAMKEGARMQWVPPCAAEPQSVCVNVTDSVIVRQSGVMAGASGSTSSVSVTRVSRNRAKSLVREWRRRYCSVREDGVRYCTHWRWL